MRRQMKIGGRVNLLIAVPLLALVACSALGYVALQRASVRGEQYRALKVAQDLRADTLPAPASVLSAWAEVNAMAVAASSPDGFNAANRAALDGHLRAITSAEQDFADAMDRWAARSLSNPDAAALTSSGRAAGEAFFAAVRRSVLPAVQRGDAEGVAAAVRALEPSYTRQQQAVQGALNWAEAEVVAREAETDDFIAKVSLFGGAGAALVALTTLLMSVRVRRSIVGPVRALAAQATAVAQRDLPAAVNAMTAMPADGEVQFLHPFEVASTDELAELASSFNSMQRAAIELAAEQARTRRIVSDNLGHVARRNQELLSRALGHVMALERTERDPQTLDELFRIDHLATRMRRNAQSLLVLVDAEPDTQRGAAMQLDDVVRFALSGVENYGQVEVGELGSVAIGGHAALDVAHLLAELLENATSFSTASEPVAVVGRPARDGYHLAVVDHGSGLSADDLTVANAQLDEVAALHRDSGRMLGFQVVARLARRHGIKVVLTTTPGGSGVTAVVRLPAGLVQQVGEELPVVLALGDLPEASARLTMPLPVVPMLVEPVSLASFESSVSTGEVDAVG